MDMLSQLLQQMKSPTEQFEDMLENAKRNAAAEQSAPMIPMEYIDPLELTFQQIHLRDEFDRRIEEKELKMRTTYIGTATKSSSTPLEKLKLVHLNGMKIRKHHKGRFLLCRIIAPPSRLVCVSLGVEDPNGWSQLVSVYNFPGTFDANGKELDTIFPLYTILAIREPTAKMALVGNHSHIRIDSPSDIIFIEPNDPVLADVKWANGRKTPPMATASPKEWKAVGDNHFKAEQFFAAAVAYSNALDKDPSSTTIRLNRCLAHIRLTKFSFAAHDAQIVLDSAELSSADRKKALYRAALAQYGSGKYNEAESYYKECLAIDPSLKEAITGVTKCRKRIQEQENGIYDWKKLLDQGEVPCARPDVADYTGPVKVSSMPKRGGGRGLIATKDIIPGELLFVSKAFVASFPQEADREGQIFAMNFLTNSAENGTQYALLPQTVAKIGSNDHISTPLLELYAGQNSIQALPTSQIMNYHNDIGHPLKFLTDIDTGRVESIISFNAFGLETSSKVVESSVVPVTNSPTALYTYLSFLNHSCIANAKRETFGHLMVIRAVTNIAAGEEITISYCGSEAPYPVRKKAITKYIEECDCSLCVGDRASGQRFHEALMAAEGQVLNGQFLSLKALREIVNKVDALYPVSYPVYRPASYGAHNRLSRELQLAIFKVADPVSYVRLCREAIQNGIIALEALCLKVTDKDTSMIQPSPKRQVKLPVELNRIPYNSGLVCMTCWMIVVCFLTMGNEWRAEMWLRVAVWFEDKSFGGGIPLFRTRYSEVMKNLGSPFEVLLDKIERST